MMYLPVFLSIKSFIKHFRRNTFLPFCPHYLTLWDLKRWWLCKLIPLKASEGFWLADQTISTSPTALCVYLMNLGAKSDIRIYGTWTVKWMLCLAFFPVQPAKTLNRITHLSGSLQVIEIHRLPRSASVIMRTLAGLNYILIFPRPALRYRSAAMMRLDFLCPPLSLFLVFFSSHLFCHLL